MVEKIEIATPEKGLLEITERISQIVTRSGVREGLCTVFLRHTSASLVIQENAAMSARQDLERWLDRLVPEHDPLFTHRDEGPDDMPAHIKTALTSVSIGIPVVGGRLCLGTWQGIFLWEHRRGGRRREIAVHIGP